MRKPTPSIEEVETEYSKVGDAGTKFGMFFSELAEIISFGTGIVTKFISPKVGNFFLEINEQLEKNRKELQSQAMARVF